MITKNYNLNYVKPIQAKIINEILRNHGRLTENRVMILCPPVDARTAGGIILPGTAKDELPKKGILVQMGNFDKDNRDYEINLSIGQKITFGMYAGKEITFEEDIFSDVEDSISLIPEGSKFTILSCNEIIYIENIK